MEDTDTTERNSTSSTPNLSDEGFMKYVEALQKQVESLLVENQELVNVCDSFQRAWSAQRPEMMSQVTQTQQIEMQECGNQQDWLGELEKACEDLNRLSQSEMDLNLQHLQVENEELRRDIRNLIDMESQMSRDMASTKKELEMRYREVYNLKESLNQSRVQMTKTLYDVCLQEYPETQDVSTTPDIASLGKDILLLWGSSAPVEVGNYHTASESMRSQVGIQSSMCAEPTLICTDDGKVVWLPIRARWDNYRRKINSPGPNVNIASPNIILPSYLGAWRIAFMLRSGCLEGKLLLAQQQSTESLPLTIVIQVLATSMKSQRMLCSAQQVTWKRTNEIIPVLNFSREQLLMDDDTVFRIMFSRPQ